MLLLGSASSVSVTSVSSGAVVVLGFASGSASGSTAGTSATTSSLTATAATSESEDTGRV